MCICVCMYVRASIRVHMCAGAKIYVVPSSQYRRVLGFSQLWQWLSARTVPHDFLQNSRQYHHNHNSTIPLGTFFHSCRVALATGSPCPLVVIFTLGTRAQLFANKVTTYNATFLAVAKIILQNLPIILFPIIIVMFEFCDAITNNDIIRSVS